MKNYWRHFNYALRLQKWPLLSNADQLLQEQKKKLDRLYGLNK